VTYLLDTNVLIDAKNRYYGFDICPGFWEWIDAANEQEKVYSVSRVFDEVCSGKDDLTEWAKSRRPLFLDPDGDVVDAMREVSEWVTGTDPPYQAAAIAEFLGVADYFLVSHAKAHGFVVVTAEVSSDTVKRVKIPNACKGVGVEYTDLFTMLRTEEARFVAPQPAP
jgi:predicted nucleic acid-binding protein